MVAAGLNSTLSGRYSLALNVVTILQTIKLATVESLMRNEADDEVCDNGNSNKYPRAGSNWERVELCVGPASGKKSSINRLARIAFMYR